MITDQFKQAVKDKDLMMIKILLKNSLTMDLSFKQFARMLEYAVSFVPSLIEPHDRIEFESKENWTKDYTSELKVDLVDNFSAERIAHIKEVQRVVYADEIIKQQQAQNSEHTYSAQTAVTQRSGSEYSSRTIDRSINSLPIIIASLGAATASILLGVIKGWALVTVASTAVIATCVVGGITYYVVRSRN